MKKLECIKTQTVWWGTEYQEGNEYEIIDEINEEKCYVTDIKEHTLLTNKLLEDAQELIDIYAKHYHKDPPENTEDSKRANTIIEKQKRLTKEMREYKTTILLPFVVIQSDLESHNNTFCIMTKDEVKEMYGMEKVEFDTTTYFLEDYFKYKE